MSFHNAPKILEKGFAFKLQGVAGILVFFVRHGSIRSFGARKTEARQRGQVWMRKEKGD